MEKIKRTHNACIVHEAERMPSSLCLRDEYVRYVNEQSPCVMRVGVGVVCVLVYVGDTLSCVCVLSVVCESVGQWDSGDCVSVSEVWVSGVE